MNRQDRELRDAEVVREYYAGVKPRALAARYGCTEAGIFLILKRAGTTTRIHRGAWAGGEVSDAYGALGRAVADRDAVVLTANGFCRGAGKASGWLRKADHYQQHPHQFNARDMGITPTVLDEVNAKLREIKAYVTTDAPYSVFFTTRNAFLALSFRQVLLLAANPFAYIMQHRDEVRDFNGMLAPLAQPSA